MKHSIRYKGNYKGFYKNNLITAPIARREPVWHDYFNEPDINQEYWTLRSGNYHNRYFMPADYSENAFIQDGNLIIRNIKNDPAPGFAWSGAFLQTYQKYSFKYGTVEARIKFPPATDKYHSTFWLMGNNWNNDANWPNCGEIDLAEANNGTVQAAVHWQDAEGVHRTRRVCLYNVIPEDFNTYKMIWDEDKLTFYVNNVWQGSFNIAEADKGSYNAFRQPFWMMLNSNPSLDGIDNVDVITTYIDFISVYE